MFYGELIVVIIRIKANMLGQREEGGGAGDCVQRARGARGGTGQRLLYFWRHVVPAESTN